MNSIVAILSGVFSDWLVNATNTKRAPFMPYGRSSSYGWDFLASWPHIRSTSSTETLFPRPRTTGTVTNPPFPPLSHLLRPKMP
ncbi:uncharacterized protein RSE6_06517 [Rhynchosporium secalis]|uniref:Uncharacterized protein n=1 Tax=Rhynchosporium secalis TaxID=38038 RepID=A0A1E1MAR0_RHYSE|nr:uncharacterized protein RSE6_06517 [Rhynchosporium secalis]